MPVLNTGLLQGFHAPDYDGGSILNLIASIIRSRGGDSPHGDLRSLPADELRKYERIVYLVLDGLGEEQLARHLERGGGKQFFSQRSRQVLTSVFPATTASAITTLTTGASPAEHGVVGWFLNLPDLGAVSTILLAEARTGAELALDDFPLRDYLALPSYVETVPCPTALISHEGIPYSRYSLAGTRWREKFSVKSLSRLERRILEFAKKQGAGLAHAYWPVYDTLCHNVGAASQAAYQHLEDVDNFLARVAGACAETGCAVLVTSDHGLVDVPLERYVNLSAIAGFYDCLATLASGDARSVYCFVRPSKVEKFLEIVSRHLSDACVAIAGEELLRLGWFGPGEHHRALRSRIGDWVLLAREGYALSAPRAFEEWKPKRGNHGGASSAEMLVPLFILD